MALEIVAVQDKWAELLPPKVPLRYAFFRYLGFCIKKPGVPGNTSAKALKLGSRAALRVSVKSSRGVIYEQRVSSAFSDGTYYVQDMTFMDEGLHTFTVTVDSASLPAIPPYVRDVHIHQFMRIPDEPALLTGPYATLRQLVDPLIYADPPKPLGGGSDNDFAALLRSVKHGLRLCDAKWWMKACVLQGEIQAQKQRDLQKAALKHQDRPFRRKPSKPIRSGDKRDHDGYFEGRQKDVKRQRRGEIRIFSAEALSANETSVIFSKKELHQQLALYAQK
ncbi:hypothetical protein ACHHYP_09693 [Achlya hypogyna]|uniref:Uncharacterized protein n=1 Tax=Achlya hypogyna TaxID=1202772 RepID=A0A1V9YML4_ACHHY|nr:hypothetical protein ACHHYP_09693 [Achlya hypogyna]